MKLTYTLFLLLLAFSSFAQFVNRGAVIHISEGAVVNADMAVTNTDNGSLTVDGQLHTSADLTNTGGATLQGDGRYEVEGNWNNDAIFLAGTSRVTFRGNGNSSLDPGVYPFHQLSLNKDDGSNLILNSGTQANDTLFFESAGLVQIGNFVLQTGAVQGAGPDRYVQTGGTGQLAQVVGSQAVEFPIGKSTYNPATLTENAAPELYAVRVSDEVLENGNTGAPLTSVGINRSWHITEETAGGSDLDLVLQWNEAEEQASFDRSESGIYYYNGSHWETDDLEVDAATGSDPYQQDRPMVPEMGVFTIGDGCILIDSLSLTEDPLPSRVYKADDILVSDDLVKADSTVEMVSANMVRLEPGFTAEPGSDFWAYIQACGSPASTLQAEEQAPAREKLPVAQEARGEEVLSEVFHFTASPNPFRNFTLLEYELGQSGKVQLQLFDAQGGVIKTIIPDAFQSEGVYRVELDTRRLPAGQYVAVLQTAQGRQALQLVKIL